VRVHSVMRLLVLGGLAAAMVLSGSTDASSGATTRVSVDSAGNEANERSNAGALSEDGRYVAFESSATNLIPGFAYHNVFLLDRQTGSLEHVGTGGGGSEPGGGAFELSDDARFIAFESGFRIYVRDRLSGVTDLASVDSTGVPLSCSGGSQCDQRVPSIDGAGRYVAFHWYRQGQGWHIVIRDRQEGTTWVTPFGGIFPKLSDDGRYVVYSDGSIGPPSGAVSIIDITTQQSEPLPLNGYATVSAEGRYVATAYKWYDRQQLSLALPVCVSSAGEQANAICGSDGSTMGRGVDMDAAGRYVVFQSAASNLAAGDANGTWDVFVRDMETGTTAMLSTTPAGVAGNGDSTNPSIAGDGCYVVFQSEASDLVPGDTNAVSDVFVVGNPLHDDDCTAMPTPTPTSTATPTPTRTLTPTATATPKPQGVGGIVMLPSAAVAAQAGAQAGDSRTSSQAVGVFATGAAAILFAVVGRRLRRRLAR